MDDIDIASGDVGLNMLDTAVATSEGQQIPVSIFKDTGTVTRPKTQIEATLNTFPGMPPTIEKTGALPPKGTGTTVDFNTMTSDTLTSDSLFTSEEDKGRTRLFNNRGYNDIMEERNLELRMQQQRDQTRLDDEEARKRSQTQAKIQAQVHAQTQAMQDQQIRAQQMKVAQLREEEARLMRKEQQLENDRQVAIRVKEQVDKVNKAQEERMDKLHELLIKNADKDPTYRPKELPTYQRHTKAAQPAKFKGEGEKLPDFRKSFDDYRRKIECRQYLHSTQGQILWIFLHQRC